MEVEVIVARPETEEMEDRLAELLMATGQCSVVSATEDQFKAFINGKGKGNRKAAKKEAGRIMKEAWLKAGCRSRGDHAKTKEGRTDIGGKEPMFR